MRFKLVPAAPDSLEFVADAQRAVPLVPGTEDDCCGRLMRRLDLPSRDVARTWLTFLRALELADKRESGFVRQQREPTPEQLRGAFLSRVFAAEETLATLSTTEPLDADTVFERVESRVPTWEHHKNPSGWRETWRERVATILEWLVLLDLASSTPEGYLATGMNPAYLLADDDA